MKDRAMVEERRSFSGRGRSPRRRRTEQAAPWEGQAPGLLGVGAASGGGGWRLYYAENGCPYYYDHDTGESAWAESLRTQRGRGNTAAFPPISSNPSHLKRRGPYVTSPELSADGSSSRSRSASSDSSSSSGGSSSSEGSGGDTEVGEEGSETGESSSSGSDSDGSEESSDSDVLSSEDEEEFRYLLRTSEGRRALALETQNVAQIVEQKANLKEKSRQSAGDGAVASMDEEAQMPLHREIVDGVGASDVELTYEESSDDELLEDDVFVKRVDQAIAVFMAGPTAARWLLDALSRSLRTYLMPLLDVTRRLWATRVPTH